MFGDRKVAHIAAYLLDKADGKALELVKLMKLMYLADREALRQTDASISGDRFIKDRFGPVLEHTLGLMEGKESISGEWEDLITGKGPKITTLLGLRTKVARNDLDELSPRACSILDQVWEEFGSKTADELVGYTHKLEEWKLTGEKSDEIKLDKILRALGRSKERAEGLAAFHAERRRVNMALAGPRFERA